MHSEVFEPPSPDRCLFQLAFSSKKNMVAFPALTSAEGLKALDKDIKDVVIEAADFAQTSPEPGPSELWTDIIIAA